MLWVEKRDVRFDTGRAAGRARRRRRGTRVETQTRRQTAGNKGIGGRGEIKENATDVV